VGQSERGSYVARIICPMAVTSLIGQSRLADFDYGVLATGISETETRRVTSYLMQSANFVIKSIRNEDNYDMKRLFNRESEDPVVSANFCQAMQDLEPAMDGTEVTFNMIWAGGVKPRKETPSFVELYKEDFEPLPKIIEKLMPLEQQIDDEFLGRIKQTREVDEGDLDEASLSEFILGTDYNDRLINAKILLSGEDRRIAHLASTERYHVRVKGKLRREKRTYFIDNAKIHTIDDSYN
jgi:hypothetical protein